MIYPPAISLNVELRLDPLTNRRKGNEDDRHRRNEDHHAHEESRHRHAGSYCSDCRSAPIVEAATETPQAEKLDFVGGIAEIHNRDGFVTTVNAGAGASSECHHRGLDTLLPHVAVPVGTTPETVAELLAALS